MNSVDMMIVPSGAKERMNLPRETSSPASMDSMA
jgi:hypothetical protein